MGFECLFDDPPAAEMGEPAQDGQETVSNHGQALQGDEGVVEGAETTGQRGKGIGKDDGGTVQSGAGIVHDDEGTVQGGKRTAQNDGADGGNEDRGHAGVNYFDRYNLNEVVGLINVKQSKFEILLMIFHLLLRHGVTGSLIEDLLAFFNVICGQDVLPASKYLFLKIFQPLLMIHFHYYCTRI